MATVLPPTKVKATVVDGMTEKQVDVVVQHDQGENNPPKEYTYKGQGKTMSEAVEDVFKKYIDDPRSSEDIRRG